MKRLSKALVLAAAAMLWLFVLAGFPGAARALEASYTQADLNETVSADAVHIDLSGVSGDCLISAAGDYVLTGSLQGAIVISAGENDKVHLVADGISVDNPGGPALYVRQADKVILTLAEGSVNTLSDGVGYAADAEGANAALFSNADLTINGSGSLTVDGRTGHGIETKDDLKLVGGTLTVNAVKDGIRGRDSITVKGGAYTVAAGSDGLSSTNAEKEGKGFVLVEGGTLSVTAGTDSADGALSRKGIKAAGDIRVTGGALTVSAGEDALHADGSVTIDGGECSLRAGDDGIHAEKDLTVNGGSIAVTASYEGIEGCTVSIHGGEVAVTASDDGINAADGSAGGRANQQGVAVTVTGGTVQVTAGNDAIDSNGSIAVAGGTLDLTTLRAGPGTATLDANGGVSVTGGDITTNDGAESGGSFGGRNGGWGGFGDREGGPGGRFFNRP